MVSQKCSPTYNCDVIVELNNKQHHLTVFPEVVREFQIDETNIEEELLSFDDVGCNFQSKQEL